MRRRAPAACVAAPRAAVIKSFDFTFGFCIPNSTNSWEAIYEVPEMSDELRRDMIAYPFETQSDSFYFVKVRALLCTKYGVHWVRVVAQPDHPQHVLVISCLCGAG